jgi:hypothetical protein
MFFDETCEAHHAWILSCFGPRASAWLTSWLVFPPFLLFSPIFYTTLYTTWITPSLNCKHPLMCVHTSHQPYGYPAFTMCSWQRMHWNDDAIYDTFATIMWNVGFHVGWEQLHAFISTTFNSFHRQIDIVFTKNAFCTLANVVIANPMQTNLRPQSCTTQGFVALYAT